MKSLVRVYPPTFDQRVEAEIETCRAGRRVHRKLYGYYLVLPFSLDVIKSELKCVPVKPME